MSAEPAAAPRSEIDFDHTDSTFLKNPYPLFETLREECPIARSTRFDGFWVMSRYAELVAAARDTRTYSSARGVTIPNFGSPVPLLPIEADPPLHSAYRRLLQREFTRGRMTALGESVRAVTDTLIDAFIDRGAADLATELCRPLPSIVIAQLLGFPPDDWEIFRGYSERLLETAKSGELEANIEAALEFSLYLATILDERRDQPREDMLTRIVRADVEDRPITEDEALGLTLFTVVAGHETTVGGIGGLLYFLATVPGLQERLIAHPELVATAVEESLRLESPVQGMARTIVNEARVHGQEFADGDKIWLLWAAGNRDPRQFDAPDEFDLERKNNRHLAFGEGIHRCVGAPLAQTEMRVAAEQILRRIPGFRVTDGGTVTFAGGQNRLVTSLPVVWDTRPES
jgi:cytochrome P450